MMEDQSNKIAQLEQTIEQLKKENQRLEEKLNAALDGTGLCLWEQHVPTGKLTIFNMEWGKMLGFQPHELEANVETWKSKLHPDDYELAVGAFESHLNGETEAYQVVHRMIHKDGSHSWVSDRGRIVEYTPEGEPLRIMGTHIDITNEKRYELELAKLATQDPLTGLMNRQALKSAFDERPTLSPQDSSALIFIDVDDFKKVNDHLGHKAGDQVLVYIADWLRKLAPKNAKIARMGGDEFVIFCPHYHADSVQQFADNLLSQAYQAIRLENGEANIGFSIGVCQFSGTYQDFEMLYEHADQAMYQVKRNGKNGVSIVSI